jgi:hypothetical protein
MIICTFLPAKCQHCFRGKPLPECKTFWITEFGFSPRLDRHRLGRRNDQVFYYTWEAGLMRNVERQTAIGATLFFGADNDGHRYGLKSRYRRWLSNSVSLDLGAGVLLGGDHGFINRYPGLTSHVGLSLGDWLALTGHLEITRLEYRRFKIKETDFAWYAGAKLGSYPGLIASVTAPIVYLLIRAALNDVGLGN